MLTREFFIAQVCDQPHPLLIKSIISECEAGELDKALQQLSSLWGLGYSAVDIIGTMFRVLKTMSLQEYLKLEFIRVSSTFLRFVSPSSPRSR
jgi:replication factor C subunit 2/4